MVFPRRKRSEKSSLEDDSLRSSGSSFNRIDSFDSDRRFFESDSYEYLRDARKYTSSGSLLSFGRRRKDSIASASSSHAGSFGWNRLDNPLFRRSFVLARKQEEKRVLKAEKAIRKQEQKQREKEARKDKQEKKARAKDDERIENEQNGSKLRKPSRLRLRRKKRLSGQTKFEIDEKVLDILEDRVEDSVEPENTFTLFTKNGNNVKVYFGHDYIAIDGKLVLYEHIIYWGHTKRCLKISYIENMSTSEQDRVDVALYPTEKQEVKAEELANILQNKVALLYSELTGCSKDEALNMSTKCVTKRELNEVLDQVDETSERFIATGYTKDI